ncbi:MULTISPECIES: GTPase Era [Peptoniphilus]|nr:MULTISPECIES: GTPase Era [Peptoniphilus]ERT62342.1 GTP-binding protein Era [Peptoniphilus sp. BV3C26]
MFKSGYVGVLGRPNVGKSTLLNRIVGEKISAVSSKPQTTRNKISIIYNDEDSQIIFLDTPGMQKPGNELGKFMQKESESSLDEVDIVTYIVDTSTKIGRLDRMIIDLLKKAPKNLKIILLINKIDQVKKEELLDIINLYKDELNFEEIIPISAMMGDGIEEFMKILKDLLPEGPKYYPDDILTDRPVKFIASEIIREKALLNLKEEVPHGVAVTIESMHENEKGLTEIEAVIYCEKDSHKGILIGKNGSMLKKIGTEARLDIENLIEGRVNLKLWVKVDKNWRDNDRRLKGLGYK